MTYHRWRQEYGRLRSDGFKLMKELELENQRLRKAVADLTLYEQILMKAALGSFWPLRACVEHVMQTLNLSEHRACREP